MSGPIRDWLRSLTDIRREEMVPTGLMFLYGFLALTSYYVVKPARNSVFVDRVGADNLPYVYLLTAFLVALVMLFYSRYVDRVKEISLLLGTFCFLALNLVGFRWWLEVAGDSFVASGSFYIWGKLYPLLLVSQFYLVGNLLFTTRQARRLFGFIGVGLILGGVAGSSISGWAATAVGTEDLLLVAAGILLLCAGIVLVLAPRMGRGEGGGRLMEEVSTDALKLLRESSHLRTIAWILGLTIVVGTLVDWQFNSAVERFVPGEDAKTAFFGKFFLGLNIASVLIQILFTGFILRKFGVGMAMLALPLGLLVASLGILAAPLLFTAVLAKGTEGGLRYSLDQSTRELLYLPVPTELKYRVKPLIDLAVYRGGTGVGGLLLIVLVNLLRLPWELTIRLVAGLAILCIVLWIAVTLRMRGEFRDSIRRLIGVRDVELDELVVAHLDAETLDEVRAALGRRDAEEVLYALAILERYPQPKFAEEVARLLDHPSGKIRARAIALLLAIEDDRYMDRVRERLRDESLDVQVEAIRYECALGDREAAEALREFLEHADIQVRIAAAACALREGKAGPVRMAEGVVRELAGSEDAGRRRQAARLLAYRRPPTEEGERLLRTLLEDDEPEVRRAAAVAAGSARARDLVPLLLERLGAEADGGAAGEALESFGSGLHPFLLGRLTDAGTRRDVRRRIPALLVPDATQEIADGLFRVLAELEPGLRFEALKALNKLRRNRADLEFEEYDIDSPLEREAREAYRWAARERAVREARGPGRREGELPDTGREAAGRFLVRVLAQRRWEAAERASRILGLRFSLEDLYAAFAALGSSDLLTRQRGFELLESTLSLRYRHLLGPLLDPDRSLEEVAGVAGERYGFDPEPGTEAIRSLGGEDSWVATLARAASGLDAGTPGDGQASGRGRDEPAGSIPAAAVPEVLRRAQERETEPDIMDIIQRAELLGRTEIFKDLRMEDLAEVAALTEERTCPAGGVLFDEGASGTELFIVVEGTLEAQRGGRTLFTAEPSETVGDLSLLDGLPRNYRAVAIEDSRVLVLPREEFYTLAAERFRIVRGVHSHLARVIRVLNERAAEGEPLPRATVGGAGTRPGRAAARHVPILILLPLALAAACAGPPDGGGAPEGEAVPGRAELPDGAERRSQPAEVRQRMGSTEIAVVYNRPSARGRALYGGIVPYDSIWNPGADEATRIELSRDVMVEGRRLPAGRYSLWAIPRPDEWTLVFSRAHDVYHVPYPEGEDALRVRARPRTGPHVESLAFHFPVVAADSAELHLHWGPTVVPLLLRPAP